MVEVIRAGGRLELPGTLDRAGKDDLGRRLMLGVVRPDEIVIVG